jgi:hypothetical protein
MRKTLVLLSMLVLSLAVSAQDQYVVDAKYRIAECYINGTLDLLEAVDFCADKHSVTVDDLSSYASLVESDRATLRSATTIEEFDASAEIAGDNINDTLQAIKAANSTLEGTELNIGLARLCFAGKYVGTALNFTGCILKQGITGFLCVATMNYYDWLLDAGEYRLENSRMLGLDTELMEESLGQGTSRRDEMESACSRGDAEAMKLAGARFSRAHINYHLGFGESLSEYTRPRIEAGDNLNKDEIIGLLNEIDSDLADVRGRCPLHGDYSNIDSYISDNKYCWDKLREVRQDALGVRSLWLAGRSWYVGGTGSVHAEGTGNVTVFGAGNVTITGTGTAFVKDHFGGASVTCDVSGVSQPDGSTMYDGFTSLRVEGSGITVEVEGEDMVIDISGSGIVELQGTGFFTASGAMEGEGDWEER